MMPSYAATAINTSSEPAPRRVFRVFGTSTSSNSKASHASRRSESINFFPVQENASRPVNDSTYQTSA